MKYNQYYELNIPYSGMGNIEFICYMNKIYSYRHSAQELQARFDTALMVEAVEDRRLYITEANAPMIFFRYLPSDQTSLKVQF